jgi:hypothetical protein
MDVLEALRGATSRKSLSTKKNPKESEQDRLAPKPLDPAQEKYMQLASAYLCDEPNDTVAAFERAHTWFEAQHWEEAALAFEDIALRATPSADTTVYADKLALETYNILASHFNRRACEDRMAYLVPKFMAARCNSTAAPTSDAGLMAEHCVLLRKLEEELKRRKPQ